MLLNKGQTTALDWWALGVLIFEMLCGFSPFYDDNDPSVPHPQSKYEKILTAAVEWPMNYAVDHRAKDLVRRLVVVDATQRLGNDNGGQVTANYRFVNDLRFVSKASSLVFSLIGLTIMNF